MQFSSIVEWGELKICRRLFTSINLISINPFNLMLNTMQQDKPKMQRKKNAHAFMKENWRCMQRKYPGQVRFWRYMVNITLRWCLNLKALSHSGHLNLRSTALSSWLIMWRCSRYTLANVLWHTLQDCNKNNRPFSWVLYKPWLKLSIT